MNINNILFTNITIQDPINNNNNFIFNIMYNDKPLSINVNNNYIFNSNDKTVSIVFKDDLKFFNNLYKNITEIFYNKHDEWFQTKYEIEYFNNIFKKLLYPNIEQNCVNIDCNLTEECLKKLDDNTNFIPAFLISINVILLFSGSELFLPL